MVLDPDSDAEGVQPTPYPNVNTVVRHLLSEVQAILGCRFVAMYLSGSLALGDFDAARSDIDLVVVTDADLPDDLFAALGAMHARFNAGGSPWATEVEAAYIPRDDLRRYDPARACHPHIQRGASEMLEMDQLASDWVLQRSILRERGVVVAGPAPHPLIAPVDPDDLRRAVAALMAEWWGTMRQDSAPLQHLGYQVYAVLTMCRILYTLDRGAVASKPVAARWAQQTLDPRWAALIERALAWRKDDRGLPGDDVGETLALIEYTVERCRPWQSPAVPADR
jgi:hypothetical protein